MIAQQLKPWGDALEQMFGKPEPPVDYTFVKTEERGRSRTGSLEGITEKEITQLLGVKPWRTTRSEGDGKVTREWAFRVKVGRTFLDGHFGIWDYKNYEPAKTKSHWSTYGNADTLEKIFGPKYRRE